MAKQKGKSVSFDAMVKFFMQHYGIPTKKDVDRMVERLDRLENLLRSNLAAPVSRRASGRPKAGAENGERSTKTATDAVLDVIKSKNGIGFADIQSETGFEEKKLRNIIFRLNKLKKIRRLNRGMYEAV
ncbi:MAG: hypothetical protein C4530_01430 [Desulfobacteraceae bacterium]|nr:MAG: hypothetical protein C4530_01430 [Desulfobacteraceae bacterium]